MIYCIHDDTSGHCKEAQSRAEKIFFFFFFKLICDIDSVKDFYTILLYYQFISVIYIYYLS